jgi:RNA polymerase sigma-70 factor (ECF subfamily)
VTAADEPGRGLFPRALPFHSAPTGVDAQAVPMNEHDFQLIYDATAAPILGYLVAVTGRRDVAEDLLQETFCRLLARPRIMDATDTRRYLFRIATDLDTPIDVHAALQTLKPRERELLWLAYVEGMSHHEIASATGLQSLSVRMLLYRARNKAALLLNPGRSTR